ncbi:MAG: DPP IV N-terminal domain-containing protein [Fidelibacterota bacterium]
MKVVPNLIKCSVLIFALLLAGCQDQPEQQIFPVFQIAFASQTNGQAADIFLIDSDGENLLSVTTDPARDEQPQWSPDGQRLLFISNRDGHRQLFLYDLVTDSLSQLTHGNRHCTEPAWSPDGNQITYQSDSLGLGDIFILDLPTEKSTQLTDDPAADISPAWSPDGNRIAFVSHRDGNAEIYVMDSDGNNQTRLTDNPRVDLEPTWSPDGEKIAFTSHRKSSDEHVYILDVAARTSIQLATPNSDEYNPVWSVDGTKLYYFNILRGDIYWAAADGNSAPELIFDFAKALDLSLSPDGQVLVFAAGIGDSPSAVYTFYLESGKFRRVTDTPGPDRTPAVRPAF